MIWVRLQKCTNCLFFLEFLQPTDGKKAPFGFTAALFLGGGGIGVNRIRPVGSTECSACSFQSAFCQRGVGGSQWGSSPPPFARQWGHCELRFTPHISPSLPPAPSRQCFVMQRSRDPLRGRRSGFERSRSDEVKKGKKITKRNNDRKQNKAVKEVKNNDDKKIIIEKKKKPKGRLEKMLPVGALWAQMPPGAAPSAPPHCAPLSHGATARGAAPPKENPKPQPKPFPSPWDGQTDASHPLTKRFQDAQ